MNIRDHTNTANENKQYYIEINREWIIKRLRTNPTMTNANDKKELSHIT